MSDGAAVTRLTNHVTGEIRALPTVGETEQMQGATRPAPQRRPARPRQQGPDRHLPRHTAVKIAPLALLDGSLQGPGQDGAQHVLPRRSPKVMHIQ